MNSRAFVLLVAGNFEIGTGVGAGFRPARPNDSSAFSREPAPRRRTLRHKAGGYVRGNARFQLRRYMALVLVACFAVSARAQKFEIDPYVGGFFPGKFAGLIEVDKE